MTLTLSPRTTKCLVIIYLVFLMQACAPITRMPSSTQTPPSQTSQSSSQPSAPSSSQSNPSDSKKKGTISSGGQQSQPKTGSQASNARKDNNGQRNAPSGLEGVEDDWLNQVGKRGPTADDIGWQTSNTTTKGARSEKGVSAASPRQRSDVRETSSSTERELNGILEDIDGNILAEREVISKNRANSRPLGSTQSGTAKSSDETKTAPSVKVVDSAVRLSPSAASGASEALPKLPDARDDDIISRQLREAAMQESDPELREKLWKEFDRYKNSGA
jgi:hypothetical protein